VKTAEAPGPSPAALFPLAVGNKWTYRLEAPGAGGQQREETVQIVGRDGAWFLDDHRQRLLVDSEGVRDADRYLLRAPLKTGATWSAVDNLVVQRFQVTATEATAVTRAGKFTGCVIVRNEIPIGSKGEGRYVTEWTYAPGVGLVELRTSAVTGGKIVPQTQLSLVSFELAGGVPGGARDAGK
jgi:hypothetical protein